MGQVDRGVPRGHFREHRGQQNTADLEAEKKDEDGGARAGDADGFSEEDGKIEGKRRDARGTRGERTKTQKQRQKGQTSQAQTAKDVLLKPEKIKEEKTH
ncbi:hypothetical protein NDU88_001069 [Pleurodeles waltl]|uniref:Uncharacterized protein n=1 Tax=Pleurodeles waltl TaxID=8319 RepID=A0AAV7SBI1_PLEWA|nr:hypothetical protein NDU88_001069 [Pleurodeles waltl]